MSLQRLLERADTVAALGAHVKGGDVRSAWGSATVESITAKDLDALFARLPGHMELSLPIRHNSSIAAKRDAEEQVCAALPSLCLCCGAISASSSCQLSMCAALSLFRRGLRSSNRTWNPARRLASLAPCSVTGTSGGSLTLVLALHLPPLPCHSLVPTCLALLVHSWGLRAHRPPCCPVPCN